jgi:hypothetical protein
MENKVKNNTQLEVDRLLSMGKSINTMIDIQAGTQDIHYLIAKIACYCINNRDSDVVELLSHDDIAVLATLNEALHDCHIAARASDFIS